MHKGRTDGTNAKYQGRSWKKPSWANPLAGDVAWNLEDDVRNIEDREDGIIIVPLKIEIFFKPGKFRIAYSSEDWSARRQLCQNPREGYVPILARSMKQNKYNKATVGMI